MPELYEKLAWTSERRCPTPTVHLDRLWSDGIGSVILYTWQQFLAAETLPLLGVGQDNHYLLTVEDPTISQPDRDPRAVQGTLWQHGY